MDLGRLVAIYRRKHGPKSKAQLDYFRGLATLRQAVEAAALAIGPDGKMFAHQWRVGKEVATKAKDALLARFPQIEACRNFDELHNVVKSATRNVKRFGILATYDTSLRIGAKLNLLPEVVYLHAGTKKGASALGLSASDGVIRGNELPQGLLALEMHEVEDFLCIFKEHFGNEAANAEDEAGCDSTPRSCS
jgi:hypothetical protein